MKKIFISITFMLTVTCLDIFAQNAADVFKASEITWFGLDYSHVKVRGPLVNVGPSGFRDEKDLRDNYFNAWNSLVISEPGKYNFWKSFRVGNVPNDLSIVNKRNSAMNATDMLTEQGGDGLVNEALVKKVITEYRTDRKDGIGCVFIIESLDKIGENSAMWVTFFDIGSKKVLFTERLVERAGGPGLKNHWITPVANALSHILRTQYNTWKSKYSK